MDLLLTLKVFGALLVIIGLIFMLFWLGRKLHPGLVQKNKNAFKLKDAFVVDPKNRIAVVNYHDTDYVILLGATHALLLDKKPKESCSEK